METKYVQEREKSDSTHASEPGAVPGVLGSYVYGSLERSRRIQKAGSRRNELVFLEMIMLEVGQ